MARSHGIQRAEVVVYTNEYGVPNAGPPELHVGGDVIELPQVQTVVATVGPNDVSRVQVSFLATLRYEVKEAP